MSFYYQALYTVTNSNYGNAYKNKSLVEIDQGCTGIARIVEVEIQQSNIPTEYEIHMGKAIEIGNPTTSNPRLSIEYRRNSIRKGNSMRFNSESSNNVTEVSGRFFNGSDGNKQTILMQSGSSANHVKESILDGLVNFKGKPYIYKTFEEKSYECSKMVELSIQLGTIRIRVPCYISNHENDYNTILGGTFLNSLDQYNIQKE